MIRVMMLTQRTVYVVDRWREDLLTIGSLCRINANEVPNGIWVRGIPTNVGFCMGMLPFGYKTRCRFVFERALGRDSEEIVSVASFVKDYTEP